MTSTRIVLIAVMLFWCAAVEPAAAGEPAAADQPAGTARPAVSAEALRIHQGAFVFDGHNDLPWAIHRERAGVLPDLTQPQPDFHTDLPRLRAGGVAAQFWSAYVPADTPQTGAALLTTLRQIELIQRMIRLHPDQLELAVSAADVERIKVTGKIASLIGIEGGHSIQNSLAALGELHRQGARYMTLTHSDTLEWADSASDQARHGGLAPFGIEVVHEMNRLGMLVDLSHVSEETMLDALDASQDPVIFSHSSLRAIADHVRNVPDEVLRRLPANGGVVMINFSSIFVVPEAARIRADMFNVGRRLRRELGEGQKLEAALDAWRAERPIPRGTVADLVDHIDHAVRVAGIDHVGLGGDLDGITTMPEPIDDVAGYPYITQELLARGYDESQIKKILGENTLRVLRAVCDR